MKRKTSSIPTRIWTFGCLPPTVGGDKVREQIKLVHEYYNVLVRIENEGRAKYREARRDFAPKIALLEQKEAELTAEVTNAEGAVKEVRRKAAAAKTNHIIRVNPKDLQTQVKTLKDKRKLLREQLKAERLKIKNDKRFDAIVEALNRGKSDQVKAARKACGLYWGSYLLAEKAMEAAKGSATDPKPKHGSGIEGRIGVQIQPGAKLTTDRFISGADHTILRLEPAEGHKQIFEPDQWETRSGRRSAKAVVCLRVGSDEQRKPIWVKFPVIIHRAIPEGEIKWAWVNVYKVGTRFKFELQLAIESKSFVNVLTGKGVVAVSIGWRSGGEGSILVGEAVDDKGRELTCVLSGKHVGDIRYPDDLQHFADKHFNTARDVLARELKSGANVPAWLREETKTLPHWRSAYKLANIAFKWTAEMFPDRGRVEDIWGEWKMVSLSEGEDLFVSLPKNPSDEDYAKSETEIRSWLAKKGLTPIQTLCLYLEWWRRKNRHLYQWACDSRVKTRGHRDEVFKIFASKLNKTYETVLLRDINWASLARRTKPEADKEIGRGVRSNRQIAAPGNLEGLIVSAVGKTRVKFIEYKVEKDLDIDPEAPSTSDGKTIATALLDAYYAGETANAAE